MVLAGAEGDEAGACAAREHQVKRAVKTVARAVTVAAYLGNTPAVCRASYIDPRVLDRFQAGATIDPALDGPRALDLGRPRVRRRVEAAVLELLG